MNKMYSVMMFVLCLNISAVIVTNFTLAPVALELVFTLDEIAARFTWEALIGSFGVGSAIAGVIGFFTRSGVYAAAALIVWSVVSLTPILQWFVLGLPIMLNILLPTELAVISTAVQVFVAIIFTMFVLEVAAQRDIT